MTKQEKIRKKQDKILNLVKAWAVIPHRYESGDAEGLIYLLSLEGVVIQVDKELPEPSWGCRMIDGAILADRIESKKAGCGFFEPLIKVG